MRGRLIDGGSLTQGHRGMVYLFLPTIAENISATGA
jgi:hypothetical protein